VTPEQLYEAGRLDDAVAALNARLRESPMDSRSRTFLFELLCFTGDYDRAQKQLDLLGDANADAKLGAFMYRTALHASRERVEMFETRSFPTLGDPPTSPSGTVNGKPFTTVEDADPRVGSRLEAFAAGQYMWIPFRHVAHIAIEPPKRLRDLVWLPGRISTTSALQDLDLGEILMPAITPLAFRHEDPLVRLGRAVDVVTAADDEAWPEGMKILLFDGEPMPLIDVRELVITPS
jgi:type VI secretion system protein ImpE